jgi:hypothetical protein
MPVSADDSATMAHQNRASKGPQSLQKSPPKMAVASAHWPSVMTQDPIL